MKARRIMISGMAVLFVVLAATFPRVLFGGDDGRAQTLIQKTCAACHRFEGKPESRFNVKAPDLMSLAEVRGRSSFGPEREPNSVASRNA